MSSRSGGVDSDSSDGECESDDDEVLSLLVSKIVAGVTSRCAMYKYHGLTRCRVGQSTHVVFLFYYFGIML